MATADAARTLESKFKVLARTEFRGETTLVIESAAIRDVALFCRDTLGFSFLIDISSVDNFGQEPRFEMVYELYQFEKGDHLRLKFTVSEDDLTVATVS